MANAQEWGAADEDLKILVELHQKDMFDFQALNSKYDQEVKELFEQKDYFDGKSKQYEEAVAKLTTMKDDEIKQMMSEESDRLRERRVNIEKKVKDHNKTQEDLEVRRTEVLKDGDNFVTK
jgi:cell division septum initiation protein DivIVA